MTDLQIPDESVTRLSLCTAEAHLHERDESCVRGIAEPVVAAELRRLAPLLSDRGTSADLLRARADELDGGPSW